MKTVPPMFDDERVARSPMVKPAITVSKGPRSISVKCIKRHNIK